MHASHQNPEFLQIHVRAYANRLYQQDRWRILERRENVVKAASVVLGTAAFADIKGFFGQNSELLAVLLLLFVVVNAVALVFQWGAKSRDAAKRSAEWTLLVREMEKAGAAECGPEHLNLWRSRCAEIESGEPSANEYLKWRAIDRACETLDAEKIVPAGRWKNFVRRLPRAFLAIA